ncbi:MAG: hypothetical protein LLF94_01690 [Chlamydiales bacterium]|nr:hypothetical protein [Chlamydiales bacterium]
MVKHNAFDEYFNESTVLGESGLHSILDQGKPFAKNLAKTLVSGGSAVFPHTYMLECGYQIAAVVHACLDSGADQVVALGVLHPMNETMLEARTKELNGKDISDEPSWGVLGPEVQRDDSWKREFSLTHFKTLWQTEIKRRGIKAPKLLEFYPSLTNRRPETLPGIKELEKIVKDSIVVATDDMCHHGIAYGVSQDDAIEIGDQAYDFAKKVIDIGFTYLQRGDFARYFDHWMNPQAIGDPTDCAIVLRYLLGNASYNVLDLKLVDLSRLFEENPTPSWVAAALVEITRD